MDWKIRNIRLQELRDIYLEKLEKVTYQLYESHLRNDIIKQEELDEEIKSYYQHTQPSLQSYGIFSPYLDVVFREFLPVPE